MQNNSPLGAFDLTQTMRDWKPVERLRQLARESEPAGAYRVVTSSL